MITGFVLWLNVIPKGFFPIQPSFLNGSEQTQNHCWSSPYNLNYSHAASDGFFMAKTLDLVNTY